MIFGQMGGFLPCTKPLSTPHIRLINYRGHSFELLSRMVRFRLQPKSTMEELFFVVEAKRLHKTPPGMLGVAGASWPAKLYVTKSTTFLTWILT